MLDKDWQWPALKSSQAAGKLMGQCLILGILLSLERIAILSPVRWFTFPPQYSSKCFCRTGISQGRIWLERRGAVRRLYLQHASRYALGYQQLGEVDFELRTMYNFRQRLSRYMQVHGGCYPDDRWFWRRHTCRLCGCNPLWVKLTRAWTFAAPGPAVACVLPLDEKRSQSRSTQESGCSGGFIKVIHNPLDPTPPPFSPNNVKERGMVTLWVILW